MIWRGVVGFEGRYEVSDAGLVRNARTGRVLRLGRQLNGYLSVNLGRVARRRVHRMVAEAFIAKPSGKDEVNHLDGNKENNLAANLEWVTHSENHEHAHRHLRRKLHCKTRAVIVDGQRRFESISAAARAIGAPDGNAAQAARLGYKCRGHTLVYV